MSVHAFSAHVKPAAAPVPRERAQIQCAATTAAMQSDDRALALLQMEVLLDIRDLLGECAVRLSTIEGEMVP